MIVTFIVCAFMGVGFADDSAVKNLIGEPDYRTVHLHWESDAEDVPSTGYQIRYCEMQTWGAQRCRIQRVIEPEQSNSIREDRSVSFAADVSGLRMATTYSFEIKPQTDGGNREDRSDGYDKNQNVIVIPTKGFSARATQCLPHASVIEVSTGPHFGGRIAVEAADGERCALDGEPSSPRDVYTLRINHTECGSQVNESTVATFVLVQENLPILTHSTRRFLVLCTYQPETLTVRAGISLPAGTSGRGHSDAIAFEQGDNYMRKSRHLRTGKTFQKPEALVTKEEEAERSLRGERSLPLAFLAIFMTVGFVGLLAMALKCTGSKLSKEVDNVSIASSDASSSSFSSTIDVETEKSHPEKQRQ